MLLGDLRSVLTCEYPEWNASRSQQHVETGDAILRTARSFGYEWRQFSNIQPEGEYNFRIYFGDDPCAIFAGTTVLDVGCGKARHLFHASRWAKTCIGVDLSAAVDAAFANTRRLPNVHIVQASVFALPFRPATFDVAYSLGVLHHLPEPEQGFRTMLQYVRPGGYVRVYLYWSMAGQPAWKRSLLWCVTQLRKLTTHMPLPMLKAFSRLVAAGCYVTFVSAYKLLRSTRWSRFAETLPLKAYADYPFGVVYQDQFDRFSAPIENRYDREEVAAWLSRAGLESRDVIASCGWIGFGRVPAKPSLVSASTPAG
jgi:SAM-dependent methyltransferase